MPASAWESPALEPACAEYLRSLGLCLVERPEGGETFDLRFPCPSQAADCPLLDTSCGCRLPREKRPLECRLWPMRLMRDERGDVVVACYKACPGLAHVPREDIVRVAKSLLPLFQERVRVFPESVRPLHSHYMVLFSLPG